MTQISQIYAATDQQVMNLQEHLLNNSIIVQMAKSVQNGLHYTYINESDSIRINRTLQTSEILTSNIYHREEWLDDLIIFEKIEDEIK